MIKNSENKRVLPEVVIYHGNCTDGFTAAWAANQFASDTTSYYPARYEDDRHNLDRWRPVVEGKSVLIVDFSFNRSLTKALRDVTKHLQVLDHHTTAQREIGDLDCCHFDMDKSGALLTWEYFSTAPAPALVCYVSDHDLWEHKLPYSQEIAAAIGYREKNFAVWDKLAASLQSNPRELASLGTQLIEHNQALAKEIAAKATSWQIAGQSVVAVNSSMLINDVAHTLLEEHDAVAVFEVLGSCVKFSLRSKDYHVGELAKTLGGGGHKHAAGFTVKLEQIDWLARKI